MRGTTALLDAVGKTILNVRNRTDEKTKVVFVITTDGMENASTEFTANKIKELIGHQQEYFGWEFIFLGANIYAVEKAGEIGIAKEMSYDLIASSEGVETMYEKVNEVVMEARGR